MMVGTAFLAVHPQANTIMRRRESAILALNCAMAALDLLLISAYHVGLPTNSIKDLAWQTAQLGTLVLPHLYVNSVLLLA